MRFLLKLFGLILMMSIVVSCGRDTCEQPIALKWKLINDTNTDQTIEFDFVSLYMRAIQTTKTVSIETNTTKEEVFLNYNYTKEPVYHGKIDFSPEAPKCSATPEEGDGQIQLHDDNAIIKLCLKKYINIVYIEDLATTCPDGSDVVKRW